MGRLLYGGQEMEVEIDDRALAHLQIVITSKLRRGESFLFSWTDALSAGSGRSSIWIDHGIPLYFRYSSGGTAAINRDWISALMLSANTPTGLRFLAEPGFATAPPRSSV
ncbi:MAG: ATP-dependent ligase [Microbacteriaceae bacterium]|jgi:hypothetical protein|nr:ATP-dependent ligase [Microbacteriaceae bacterium]HEV7957273.1 ATP-dependent DNA ligase [Marisediminicola sp.]